MKVHEKLAHLSPKEIIELMDGYYHQGVRVKSLIEFYRVDCRPKDLHKFFPPMELEECCPVCGTHFLKKRDSRTDIENKGNHFRKSNISKPYCPNCGHVDDEICKCAACEEKRNLATIKKEERLEKMANEIKAEFEKSYTGKVKIDDLNIRDRVYLASLLRYALSGDASVINSLGECENPCSRLAMGYMDEEIVDYLLKRNVIIIDTKSLTYALRKDEDSDRYMRYKLNVEIDDDATDALQDLMSPNIDFSDEESILEGYKIWKDVAMNDCITFLVDEMKKRNVEFHPVKKTKMMIGSLLDRFSIAQVQYMIDKCVEEAFVGYHKKKFNEDVLFDVIFRKMSLMDSFVSFKEVELMEYKNGGEFSYTCLQGVLFYKVLKLGDKGLRCAPSVEIVRESVIGSK